MRKLDVAVLTALTAVAVAAVVLPNLDDDKPEVLPPPTGEVVEIDADELDPAPAEREPGLGVVLNTG